MGRGGVMGLSRAKLLWAGGLALAAVLLALAVLPLRGRPGGPGAVRYVTGTVEVGRIEVFATGSGSVAWANRRSLVPEADGVIARVAVRVGQEVRKGDVLLELRNDDLDAVVEQARIQLEQARQKLAAARGAVRLSSAGAVEVRAPAGGLVTGLRVKEGDQVQQGAVLATVTDRRSVDFVTRVLENERERIRPGQEAVIRLADFEGELTGRVAAVGSSPITEKTGIHYEVRITVTNPGLLQAGMEGEVAIRTSTGDVVRTGTVDWAVKRYVTAPLAGRVESVAVSEGEEVAAGALLARLVNETAPAELAQLSLAVRQAEVTLKARESQWQKLVLRSPADGVVVALNASVGDRVGAASPPGGQGGGGDLVAVAAAGRAIVTVAVDEMEVAGLRVGQEAEVTVPALGGAKFRGRVTRVAEEGVNQSGVTTYPVEVTVEGGKGLKAGMTANVSIRTAAKDNALLVPVEAVQEGAEGTFVRVLAGGRPRQVPVRVGLRNDRVAEVLEGLHRGDRVVLAEYDPAAAALPGPGGQRGGFGPGGFPPGALMGRPPGGFGGPGGGGFGGGRGGGAPAGGRGVGGGGGGR